MDEARRKPFRGRKSSVLKMIVACATALENRPRTRVLIRKLPANIDAMTFLESLEDMLERCKPEVRDQILRGITWCHLIPNHGASAATSSIAYINFMTKADAKAFISHYKGYRFIDGQGVSYKTDCSLTTFHRQLVPQSAQPGYGNSTKDTFESPLAFYAKQPDLLCQACHVQESDTYGTYETDSAYLRFLAAADSEANPPAETAHTGAATQDLEDPVVSPAVRTAMQRRLARKSRLNRNSKAKQSMSFDEDKANSATWSLSRQNGDQVDFPKTSRGPRRLKDSSRACNSASPQVKKTEIGKSGAPAEGTPAKSKFAARRTTTYTRSTNRDVACKGD